VALERHQLRALGRGSRGWRINLSSPYLSAILGKLRAWDL
jgi:hypothetical protein